MNKRTIIIITLIALLAGGFYYVINYTKLFSNTNNYYSSFTKISGLQESGPVLMHGVKIGKVTDIYLGKDRNLHVTFAIKEDILIPEGTFAKVINGDVSGTKAVKLYISDEKQNLAPGSYIPTVPDTTMLEMFNAKITPIIKGGKFLLRTADSTLSDINYIITYGGLGRKAQMEVKLFNKDLKGLAVASGNASTQIDKWSGTIQSLNDLIKNPAQTNASINQKIASGITTTKKLSDKNFDSILKQSAASFTKLGNSINKMVNTDKLLKDKSTYINATRQLDTANTSMQELMKDPPGIQLIGGGKKKK